MLHVSDSSLNARLFLRSLLPSTGSFVGCLLAGILLVGLHLLTLALNEHVLPFVQNDNDVVLQFFTNYIVTPSQLALHSSLLNSGLLVLLWVVFAWIFFECISHLAVSVVEWRNVRREISLPGGFESSARRHPLEGSFLTRMAWQLGILFVALMSTLALLPLMRYALTNEAHLFQIPTVAIAVRKVLIDILIWTAIMHAYVVLLRWYMLRTRVFGEILY